MTDPNADLTALAAELRATATRCEASSAGAPSDSEIHSLVQSARRTLAARRRRQRLAISAGTALAAAFVVLLLFRPHPDALTFRAAGVAGVGDSWLRAEGAALPLEFSDGSRLELAPEARARVGKLTRHEARVVLESGLLHARVVHRRDTRWTFIAGHFEVAVTGTSFDLAWEPEPERLSLTMHEGSVRVSGPVLEGPRVVTGGMRLVINGRERRATVHGPRGERIDEHASVAAPGIPRPQPPSAASSVTPALVSPTPAAQPPRGTSPSWQELAGAGKHHEAMEAVDRAGFESTCRKLEARELLQLADVARLAGRFARANEALKAVRERFPGTSEAALVAYTFGRQAFDGAGHYGGAARWFRTYLEEAPNGPLAREALGRLMESQQRQGLTAAARATARQYLAAYPSGPHRDIAQKLVGGTP